MDLFKNNEAEDFHVFVTDSEWMKELGLSTFTTGTLYDWWYHRGAGGKFINRSLVLQDQSHITPSVFFNMTPTIAGAAGPHPPSQGTSEVWRFEGNNKGKYQEKKFDLTWAYADGRPEAEDKPWHGNNYDYADLDIDFFKAIKWIPAASDDINDGTFSNLLEPKRLLGLPVADGGTYEVTNIIAMNDWVRDYLVKEPDVSKWNDEAQARHRFIEDIKTSKSGCLIYPVAVTFDVAPGQLFSDDAGNLVPAHKTESFNIQLYLYDERSERKTGRTAIMSAMKHAGVPRDVAGRDGNSEDGEISEVEDKPENKVVGDVDMHMNHMTGKWQSGSKQMLAKISQTIPAATWAATAKDMEDQDNKDVLDDTEDPKHLVLGSGAAIPITMQNGNPMQWTPNYVLPKDCRKDNKEKFKVIVHNPDPGRIWETDTTVILNEINGLWMPLEFGSGVTEDAVGVSVFEGRWDFTYFATSLQYFFRDKNNARISPERAEKSFHVQYYHGDADNWNADPAQSPHLYTRNISSFDTELDGYHQFTSFDFMDRYVGGTRGETRSLGATVYGQDPIGTVISDPPPETSGPFFGCVFPNGYKGADEDVDRNGAEYYSDTRSFEVSPRQNAAYFNAGGIDSTEIAFDGGTSMESDRHVYSESPSIIDPNDPDKTIRLAMFADIFNGNHDVPHLPADIAMNASPSGSYGRPLTSLYEITKAVHNTTLTGSALRTHLKDHFFYSPDDPLGNCAYNWLHKRKYTDGDTVSHDATLGSDYTGVGAADDSAYDFQPKTANKIQFRPLKAEVYAGVTPMSETAAVLAEFERRDFYHYGERKMSQLASHGLFSIPGGTLVSKTSRDREKQFGPGGFNNLYMNGAPDFHNRPAYGLSFNVDYPQSLFASNDPSEHFSSHDSWSAHQNKWPLGPTTSDSEPAGAVGVIGAICTVSASQFINFTTDQIFGMQSDFGYRIGDTTKWLSTWGGPSLTYNDFHTTNLSARIYYAWPREQTIYDPRFFAVHHFNHGATIFDVAVRREGQDTDGDGIPDHNIAIADSTVDIRIPTCVKKADQEDTTVLNLPTELLNDYQIFGDACKDTAAAINDPLLPSGKWEINKIRRGKLLPFKYAYKRVAFPWDVGDKITLTDHVASLATQSAGVYHSGGLPQTHLSTHKFIDEPSTPDAQTKTPWVVNMVVQDLGKNYKVGDRFTIAGSDCELKVSYVTDLGDHKGFINQFELVSSGTYFDHTKLFKLSNQGNMTQAHMNKLKSFTQGSAKIEPVSSVSVHGKGFKAYLVQGRVKTMDATDAKPQMATSIDNFQLSIQAPNYPKEHSDPKELTQGNKVTQAMIDNPSDEGKYDIFFHFQNDISHTFWSRGDWGSYANNSDQYIDLTIDPV
tara:strand:+ start:8599 stop:12714 length:4116 start_codon:yes stop_codon:yes gene_type:complete